MKFILILFVCFFIQNSLTMMFYKHKKNKFRIQFSSKFMVNYDRSLKNKNSKVLNVINENDCQDKRKNSLKYDKDEFRTQKSEKKLPEYIKSIKPKEFRDKINNINSKYSEGVWFRIG